MTEEPCKCWSKGYNALSEHTPQNFILIYDVGDKVDIMFHLGGEMSADDYDTWCNTYMKLGDLIAAHGLKLLSKAMVDIHAKGPHS